MQPLRCCCTLANDLAHKLMRHYTIYCISTAIGGLCRCRASCFNSEPTIYGYISPPCTVHKFASISAPATEFSRQSIYLWNTFLAPLSSLTVNANFDFNSCSSLAEACLDEKLIRRTLWWCNCCILAAPKGREWEGAVEQGTVSSKICEGNVAIWIFRWHDFFSLSVIIAHGGATMTKPLKLL